LRWTAAIGAPGPADGRFEMTASATVGLAFEQIVDRADPGFHLDR
jgi:hypothetical protein